MTTYPIIERPAKNVRLRSRNTGDEDLEQALLTTMESGKAIMLPLAKFHSSTHEESAVAARLRVASPRPVRPTERRRMD